MESAATLVERHVPLAQRLAAHAAFTYRQNIDDVFSDALYGLVIAARRCSTVPFEPYAVSFMNGYIKHGVRDRAGFRAWRERGEHPIQASLSGLEDRKPSPYEQAVCRELWRLVDRLPDDQRIVVRGHYQLGLTQQDLARRLGTSQASIYRTLRRACLALRAAA